MKAHLQGWVTSVLRNPRSNVHRILLTNSDVVVRIWTRVEHWFGFRQIQAMDNMAKTSSSILNCTVETALLTFNGSELLRRIVFAGSGIGCLRRTVLTLRL